MAEYGEENKKIIFSETGKTHAEFKIKLQYDGISQGDFFRQVVSAYLDEDTDFMNFMHSLKDRMKVQSKRQREIIKKERKLAKKSEKDFTLTDREVESIFDLLERETGI